MKCSACGSRFFRPDWGVHPGETLRECIEERRITQRMLAVACGVDESLISNIVAGREGISARLAVRLEAPLGITAEFWAKLQALYEVGKERGEARPTRKRALSERPQSPGTFFGPCVICGKPMEQTPSDWAEVVQLTGRQDRMHWNCAAALSERPK